MNPRAGLVLRRSHLCRSPLTSPSMTKFKITVWITRSLVRVVEVIASSRTPFRSGDCGRREVHLVNAVARPGGSPWTGLYPRSIHPRERTDRTRQRCCVSGVVPLAAAGLGEATGDHVADGEVDD